MNSLLPWAMNWRKELLVAAGGTAMTLLDLKPSTIDIDFTMPDIVSFDLVAYLFPKDSINLIKPQSIIS